MSKTATTIAFFTGFAIGGATVWYFTKDMYARIAQEEIDSVKEAYANRENAAAKALRLYSGQDSENDIPQKVLNANKVQEKGNITDYVAKMAKKSGYVEYSTTVVPHTAEPQNEAATDMSEKAEDIPYVISPDEFNELDGYTPVSLTYFSDGVLSDENGIIIDDVEEIIGDGLEHFGEYEDDSVFVRNDAKRCDYEILRDERDYAEFRKNLPPNI